MMQKRYLEKFVRLEKAIKEADLRIRGYDLQQVIHRVNITFNKY